MQIAATFPKGSLKTGFSGGSLVTNLPANAGGADSIPRSGRSHGKGNNNSLQYILAWKIPWAKEPADYCPWGCKNSQTQLSNLTTATKL